MFNDFKAALSPVQRRQRRYFSGSTPLLPLFLQFNAVDAAFFRFTAVNVAIFPVQRC